MGHKGSASVMASKMARTIESNPTTAMRHIVSSVDTPSHHNTSLMQGSVDNATLQKTQKIVDKQQIRLERVRQARDRQVSLAMEKTAKWLIKEKKLEKNEKRYQKQLKDEAEYREQQFEDEQKKRALNLEKTIEKGKKIDELGHKHFKIDIRQTEKRIQEL